MTFTEIFNDLQAIDCREHIEKKNDLSYLSWSWAWGYVGSRYEAGYEIVNDPATGLPYFHAAGLGYLVRTRVTIEGYTREMWLPVMSPDNRALQDVPFEIQRKRRDGTPFTVTVPPADMMDINKTIMRCLVKNLAMFGLGLGIYAGEDLPLDLGAESAPASPAKKAGKATKPKGQRDRFVTLSSSASVPAPAAAAPADDLTGTVFDDQLVIALDDLKRVTSRAALVDVWHTWSGIYYKGGTAESAKFIQEMDDKLSAYPRTSANTDN